MRRITGFTLIELILTMAIAALVLTLGVPAFRSIIQNTRLAGQANEFMTATTLARSESVRRGVSVFVTALDDSDGANEWGQGWRVWADLDSDSTLDAGEEVRTFDPLPDGMTLNSIGNVSEYEFRATGFLAGGADTLELRVEGCSGDEARNIAIGATGRATVTREACA